MKRSKFTDEQILAIVRDGQAGRKIIDLLHPRHHRADRRRLEGQLIRGSWRRLCSSKAQATMDRGEIRPDMPVVCGMDATAQFATVDHVDGDEIKTTRSN